MGKDRWYSLELVEFRGHRNVKASHKTTLEITREGELTPKGDCIIGVEADKGLRELNPEFKEIVKSEASKLLIIILTPGGNTDLISCEGHPNLTLDDPERMIIRRSAHISSNTLCIKSSKAAKDLDRRVIEELRKGGKGVAIMIAFKKNQ